MFYMCCVLMKLDAWMCGTFDSLLGAYTQWLTITSTFRHTCIYPESMLYCITSSLCEFYFGGETRKEVQYIIKDFYVFKSEE